jgi:MerR family transcriptional regulator, light-induced transcriptional regulator
MKQSMELYTFSEAAKKIGISPRTLKQWEKEFTNLITVPRTKQGARVYTSEQLQFFNKIKELTAQKRNKQEIYRYFEAKQKQADYSERMEIETIIMEGEVIEAPLSSQKNTSPTLEHVKHELIEQVRLMKEEVSNEIKQTSDTLQQIAVDVRNYINHLQNEAVSVTNTLSQSIEQWTENTNNIHEKLEHMVELWREEKEYSIQERRQQQQEIMEREKAFRELVLAFRQAASTGTKKQKKWWKFW